MRVWHVVGLFSDQYKLKLDFWIIEIQIQLIILINKIKKNTEIKINKRLKCHQIIQNANFKS